MNKLEFITMKDRAKYIAAEFEGMEHKVKIEHYDEDCDKVTFVEPMSSFQLLVLFHAGIKCGHESLAKAFMR